MIKRLTSGRRTLSLSGLDLGDNVRGHATSDTIFLSRRSRLNRIRPFVNAGR